HWPQTQMQSGTTGINTIRIYNPVKQGKDQDPAGAFTRRWLPELGEVPDAYLQEPWKWDGAGDVLGRVYPEPLIEPVAAAREAKEKIYAVRRGEGFRAAADAIQKKHGSRKSGMPMTGRKRRAPVRKRKANSGQLSMDLGGVSAGEG
ncbi:MAG: FAD-binding domain-containing protein, partial [Pseudomonadota bacterium]